MPIPIHVSDSPAATLAAVACVVAGGPWFADGLRALRRRRALRDIAAGGLREGPVLAHGTVALESPLFAPLSAKPCAGFVLEARSPRVGMVGSVRETRAFRLATHDGVAHVDAPGARWDLRPGLVRTFGSALDLTENVAALLARSPETRWLAQYGGELVLTERVLAAGEAAGVLAVARRQAAAAVRLEDLARTGTDDAVQAAAAVTEAATEWTLGPSDEIETCVVSDHELEPAASAPPAWRVAGAAGGPVLALAGLLQLAHAASRAGLGGN